MRSLQKYPFAVTFGLLLLVGIIPLGVLVWVDASTPSPVPQQEATRLAAELDRMFKLRMEEVFTLAALPSIRAYAASEPTDRPGRAPVAMNEIQSIVAADTQVRQAFIVDLAGSMLLTTGDLPKNNLSARAFVKRPLAGQLDASAIVHDLNEFSQYYSAPILDNRGEVAGALVLRVAAQELWGAVNAAGDGASKYAVLVDENGVRLGDGGDIARTLAALGPLGATAQQRVLDEQTYGAQVTLVRATEFTHAEDLVTRNLPEALQPADLGVKSLAIRRLATRPWTVIYVTTPPSPRDWLIRFILPATAAVAVAGLAAFWLTK